MKLEPVSGGSLAAACRSRFCVGGVSIEVADVLGCDVSLPASLEPFRDTMGPSDIGIEVEWVARLAPVPGRVLFDSGTTWRLQECDAHFQFDFSAPAFGNEPYKRLVLDTTFRRAALQMSHESFASAAFAAEPLDYPLDELLIMHRLTQEKAIEVHGCGIVGAGGAGNLFVGHSGAGKSTTTRLWTSSQDVEILSDDRIILRRDHAEKQVPRFARNDKPFASSNSLQSGIRMYGTPWHGEAMFASPNSAPLKRIMVLEHGHGNVLTPLSPSEAVAELFARSFVPFHRHEYVDSALAFLEEVVESVPVYRFSFEPDQHAVDTILNLHD
jgi:hypothetical protein